MWYELFVVWGAMSGMFLTSEAQHHPSPPSNSSDPKANATIMMPPAAPGMMNPAPIMMLPAPVMMPVPPMMMPPAPVMMPAPPAMMPTPAPAYPPIVLVDPGVSHYDCDPYNSLYAPSTCACACKKNRAKKMHRRSADDGNQRWKSLDPASTPCFPHCSVSLKCEPPPDCQSMRTLTEIRNSTDSWDITGPNITTTNDSDAGAYVT